MNDPAIGPLDPRQRSTDDLEALQTAMDGRQTQLHTMMPGQIVSYNAATVTAVVQPALQVFRTLADGSRQPTTLAPIHDVPVHFPGGGGHILTFPVAGGDDCMLVFAERSIDNWYQHGGVQQPSDWRMHDITDAFALVGVRSQPHVPNGVSSSTVQLRSDDGKTVIQVDGPNQAITLSAANTAAVVFLNPQGTIVGAPGGNLGVLGAQPIPRGVITGAKQNNAALTSLIHFLAQRGDITDQTT
jgi:hypothetical protein